MGFYYIAEVIKSHYEMIVSEIGPTNTHGQFLIESIHGRKIWVISSVKLKMTNNLVVGEIEHKMPQV